MQVDSVDFDNDNDGDDNGARPSSSTSRPSRAAPTSPIAPPSPIAQPSPIAPPSPAPSFDVSILEGQFGEEEVEWERAPAHVSSEASSSLAQGATSPAPPPTPMESISTRLSPVATTPFFQPSPSSSAHTSPAKRTREDAAGDIDCPEPKRHRASTPSPPEASLPSPTSTANIPTPPSNATSPSSLSAVTRAPSQPAAHGSFVSFEGLWKGRVPTSNQIQPDNDLTENWVPHGVGLLNVECLGPDWVKAVRLWYERESDFGFNKKVTLPNRNKHRPGCVFYWQKNKRSITWRPQKIEEDIEAKFLSWWAEAQPSWRIVKGSSPRVQFERPHSPPDWEGSPVVVACGPNGLLQVLATLFFWADALRKSGESIAGWVGAVTDVLWVLQHLPEVPTS